MVKFNTKTILNIILDGIRGSRALTIHVYSVSKICEPPRNVHLKSYCVTVYNVAMCYIVLTTLQLKALFLKPSIDLYFKNNNLSECHNCT